MTRVAILASGSGSNAEKIVEYLNSHDSIRVTAIVTNNQNAGVIERAERLRIPVEIIPNKEWSNPERVLTFFSNSIIDLIVLAGYLRLISEFLNRYFHRHIVIIHSDFLSD